eukprot:1025683-Pleurochrysis_carterae.AAC.1
MSRSLQLCCTRLLAFINHASPQEGLFASVVGTSLAYADLSCRHSWPLGRVNLMGTHELSSRGIREQNVGNLCLYCLTPHIFPDVVRVALVGYLRLFAEAEVETSTSHDASPEHTSTD